MTLEIQNCLGGRCHIRQLNLTILVFLYTRRLHSELVYLKQNVRKHFTDLNVSLGLLYILSF